MKDLWVVPRRAVEVHEALSGVGIASAVGGALALAYHIAEPRATQDVDLNVSLDKADAERVLRALPDDVEWGPADLAAIQRDGQVRLWWPVPDDVPMPLDLFFAEHEFHRVLARRVLTVPMLDDEVKILSATDLVVFKALFDRGKDWVDIEEIVRFNPPSWNEDEAVRWIAEIVGPDDSRIARLRALAPLSGIGHSDEKPFRWT
jgi:hypothetical protein